MIPIPKRVLQTLVIAFRGAQCNILKAYMLNLICDCSPITARFDFGSSALPLSRATNMNFKTFWVVNNYMFTTGPHIKFFRNFVGSVILGLSVWAVYRLIEFMVNLCSTYVTSVLKGISWTKINILVFHIPFIQLKIAKSWFTTQHTCSSGTLRLQKI